MRHKLITKFLRIWRLAKPAASPIKPQAFINSFHTEDWIISEWGMARKGTEAELLFRKAWNRAVAQSHPEAKI